MSSSSSSDLALGDCLTLTGVRHAYGGLVAVDVDKLSIRSGQITALIGPNGAGKTTLFDIISGFVKPDRGTIVYRDRSIAGRRPHLVARLGLVRTFQLTRVFPTLTVLENMLTGAKGDKRRRLLGLAFGWRDAERIERDTTDRALELIGRFDLAKKVSDRAGDLSGGQRKLLEMARALMIDPSLLLLDEPLAGVNPALRERLCEHIQELAAAGQTVLLIEHDLPSVLRIADRVIVLDHGSIIADAAPSVIVEDPAVIEAYMGRGYQA